VIQDIAGGEELFIHYGMDMEEAPEWYLNSWETFRAD
jgi:SET domain-containing protein